MNKKNKKEKRKNIYAKALVRKRNKFYLTFSHGILFINNTLAFSQWKLWQLNLKENCRSFWKRKAKQFQCKPRHMNLWNLPPKIYPSCGCLLLFSWLQISIILDCAGCRLVFTCRQSVIFFSILLVVSYIFRLCRKSINLIQTFLHA